VGRKQLLESLQAALDGSQRLITLVGLGGGGKTRTAIEFAQKQIDRFQPAGGCWFCDLESARTLSELCSAVGQVFGIQIGIDSDPVQTLGHALANRGRSLIILDTFEQLAEFAQDSVSAWLKMAPEVCFLVTSRQPLELDGEHLIECGPLDAVRDGKGMADAVTLFIDRAKQVAPEFTTGVRDIEKISRIARRLDGNPLAIELAAAQMSTLSVGELLKQLNRRFEILTRKDGDERAPRRQQTLLGAMEWSWDLLKPYEQTALAQSSVFRAGFDPEAAEAVIDLLEFKGVPWTLEVLNALRKHSLLTVREPDAFPGEIRYRLYQTIRDFAREKLRASGGRKATRARHTAHYLEIGNRLRHTVGEDKEAAWKRLDLELGNLLAVHQRALGQKPLTATHVGQSIDAALAMHPVLSRRGPLERYLLLLDASIDALKLGETVPGSEFEIRMARGQTRRTRGMLSAAKDDMNRALAVAMGAGDEAAEGRARTELGAILMDVGELKPSEVELQAALKIHNVTGDLAYRARTLNSLGNIRFICGALDKARACFESALPLYKAVGETGLAGVCRTNLAMLLQAEGRLVEARSALLGALEIQRRTGARLYEGYCLACLGIVAHESVDFKESRNYYARAHAVFAQVGNRRWEGVVHGYLSLLCHETEDLDAALSHARQAEAILSEVGDLRCKCFFQACLGAIEATRNNVEAASRALNSASGHADKLQEALVSMTVEACFAFLDLAREDRGSAARRLSRVQELLANDQSDKKTSIQNADMSDILRITVRMLKRRMGTN
jgi:predicted ATPase